MRDHRERATGDGVEPSRFRLTTVALVGWVIFVHLAYYWHVIQAYGTPLLNRFLSPGR